MLKNIILVFIATLIMTACGGGGGSSSLPSERPSGTITGTAFDGLILNGTVKIYSWSSAGKGALLGEGNTDSLGDYSITLSSSATQPVFIEVTGGRYIEEASGRNIPLQATDKLYAVVNYTQGESVTTSVTYFTTIATGYAEYLTQTGTGAAKAIDTANALMSTMTGFDIIKTKPLDVTDIKNATPILTDGHVYGFTAGAISHTTRWISEQNSTPVHAIYNSIRFATTAYNDIRHDGKLDGNSALGLVAEGIVKITPEIYRSRLATNILVMANDPNNLTGLTAANLVNDAVLINGNNSSVFAGSAIIPLENNKPIFSNFTHTDSQIVAGSINIGFDAVDLTGLEYVNLTIDGTLHSTASDLSSIVFMVNTLSLTDAAHSFKFEAKNNAGGITTETISLTIANQAISISNLNPAEGQHINGSHDFTAQVADAFGVQSTQFIIDDAATFNPTSLTNPVFTLDTVPLSDGAHTFKVAATNINNFSESKTTNFIVDNTPPVISFNDISAYSTGSINIQGTINDTNISKTEFFVSGDLVNEINSASSFNFSLNTNVLPEGAATIVVKSFDVAGNTSMISKNTIFDHFPPVINITSPTTGAVIKNNFTISGVASDNVGIESVQFFIDGVSRGFASNVTSPSKAISIAGFSEGLHTIVAVAKDNIGREVSATSHNVNFQHIPPTISGCTLNTSSSTGRLFKKFTNNYRCTLSNGFTGSSVVQVPASTNFESTSASIIGNQLSVNLVYTSQHSGSVKYKIVDPFGVSSNVATISY